MIDIHCHILPGIDDGPETIDEALEMCRMTYADGVKIIVATPHFNPGVYEPASAKIMQLIDELETRAKEKGINIKILPGADVAVTPELPVHFKKEEYLTINGRYGIRDFYASNLRGTKRLKFSFETVRYLKWNFYNFRFTNYLFTDFAFLSNSMNSILSQDFYAGIGAGLRIFNESLVFKIVDIRFTWFPLSPPEGLSHFGTNLQGLTKSRFEDFLGRKPEGVRYQ